MSDVSHDDDDILYRKSRLTILEMRISTKTIIFIDGVRQESGVQRTLLDELPDVYRSIITLIDLQEMDYTEAAQILQVPLGTVKSRLARARLQMKLKLQSRQNGYVASNSLQALTM